MFHTGPWLPLTYPSDGLGAKQTPSLPGRRKIRDHYDVVGFISSGTYGRVYKAVHKGQSTDNDSKAQAFAIKKSATL